MAFDTRILIHNKSVSTHTERIENYEMVKERVVDYTKDWPPFINQSERDADERETMDKVRSAIWPNSD